MTGPEVTNALNPFGLQLRHYPQSWEFSTVGGWVATRAGGHFATRYTHIDDLLVGVRTIAPAATMDTLPVPRSGAGPEPMRSVLGAEGTTGIVTAATLRVFRPPRLRAGFDAFFRNWTDAMNACRQLLQSGLTPSNCRLLDAREAMINQVDGSGRAILLVSFESDGADAQALADVAAAMIEPAADELRPSRSGERQQAQTWKNAFLDAPYLQPRLLRAGITVDTFETSTSWSGLADLRRSAISAVSECARSWGGPALVSTRLTHAYHDGACLYVTWITATASQPLEQWASIKAAANEVLREHRASASHHHSVGREHLPVYLAQTPPDWLAAQHEFRRSVDPAGLLVPWLQSSNGLRSRGSQR
jgi:alkyldihydroxyacetonephosphate synthase